MDLSLIYNILGIAGLISILAAFFLLQMKKISDDDNIYNILNIIGGIFIGVYSFSYRAYFSVILNLVWSIVAFWDLYKNLSNKKPTDTSPL